MSKYSYEDACSIDFTIVRLGNLDAGECVKIKARFAANFETEASVFRAQLEEGLERWFRTEDGADAWRQSVEDFNILDLAMENLSNPVLSNFLAESGIWDLSIDHIDVVSPDFWHVDTILRDADKAEEATCRYCGGDCPIDEAHACDGYLGDVDGLYKVEEAEA